MSIEDRTYWNGSYVMYGWVRHNIDLYSNKRIRCSGEWVFGLLLIPQGHLQCDAVYGAACELLCGASKTVEHYRPSLKCMNFAYEDVMCVCVVVLSLRPHSWLHLSRLQRNLWSSIVAHILHSCPLHTVHIGNLIWPLHKISHFIEQWLSSVQSRGLMTKLQNTLIFISFSFVWIERIVFSPHKIYVIWNFVYEWDWALNRSDNVSTRLESWELEIQIHLSLSLSVKLLLTFRTILSDDLTM